jgi:Flp pilus assembly protein TadG
MTRQLAAAQPGRILSAWLTRQLCPGRLREDRGSATAWAIGIVAVVALLAGAVLDGGNAMAARVQALDIAQQAARAGANQLDLGALREHGVVRLNPGAAQAAAAAFLAQSGATGTATATANEATVTVTRSQPTLVLQAIGVDAISMTATATAVAQTGP